jgi:hypothetical protein
LDIVIGEENVQLSQHAQQAFPSLMEYYKEKNIDKLFDRIKNKYFFEVYFLLINLKKFFF